MLFVCVHNAGRSQMAAGLRQAPLGRARSTSARPAARRASEINPAVVEAMNELGVDMSEEFPKPLTDEVVRAADVVITMGCGDACPIYPGKKYEDWELDDPAGQDLETVRADPRRDRPARAEADRRAAPDDAATEPSAARPALARLLAAEFDRHVRARLRRLRRDHGRRQDPRSSATSASRSRFGLVIMVMIYAVGHISGAHFNPAVTFAFALTRHFPWPRALGYWAAQLARARSPRRRSCAARSGTSPTSARRFPSGSQGQSFLWELVLSFFLMFVIMAVATDTRAVGEAAAIAIGGTVGLDAMFGGPISGASMNPARSIGPALVSRRPARALALHPRPRDRRRPRRPHLPAHPRGTTGTISPRPSTRTRRDTRAGTRLTRRARNRRPGSSDRHQPAETIFERLE